MAETPVPPFLPSGALQPGHVLGGRYALTTLLARGGMADVWQARDMVLERQVAVKVLHPHLAADAHFVGRFRSEAVAAARLHHPSIVAIFDTCSDNGVEAIVMELVHGHTLREELDTHGPMDPRIVADFGADLANALEAAHRAGLVHRDVKPANILLCEDQRVMITDFGIAKIRDEADRTQTGTMLGSVKYLSPEQVDGQPVDARTDVYSLGVVLYETVTGRVPFLADTPAATALARLHNVPPRPRQIRADVPPALDDVIMRALAREPDDRFPSSADLASALLATRIAPLHVDPDITEIAPRPTPDRALTPSGATAPVGGAAPPGAGAPTPGPAAPEMDFGPSRSRRRWGLALLALVVIAAAIGVTTVLILRTDRGKQIAGQVTTGTSAPPAGTAVKITGATSFDPEGDNDEVESQVGALTDGSPASTWHTEYYTNRTFSHPPGGPGKSGAGFFVTLAAPTALGSITVDSPSQDWAAQVYVADKPGATLADWGQPVDQKTGINGNATFDLQGTTGSAVLVWITDLGSGPTAPTGPPNVYVQVSDVSVQGA